MTIDNRFVFDFLDIKIYEDLLQVMERIISSDKLEDKHRGEIEMLLESLKIKHTAIEHLSQNIAKIRDDILNLNKLVYQQEITQEDLTAITSKIKRFERMIEKEQGKLQNKRALFLRDVYVIGDILNNVEVLQYPYLKRDL